MCTKTSKTIWPEMEDTIFKWVIHQHQNGYTVTTNAIQTLRWAKLNINRHLILKLQPAGAIDLCSGNHLIYMEKLSEELENKIINFREFILQLHKKNCISIIWNMDETLVNFDMLSNRTVNMKGEETIHVKKNMIQ